MEGNNLSEIVQVIFFCFGRNLKKKKKVEVEGRVNLLRLFFCLSVCLSVFLRVLLCVLGIDQYGQHTTIKVAAIFTGFLSGI